MLKKCSRCGKEKPSEYFYKEKRAKDGHTSACKRCILSRQSEYAKKNKLKISIRQKQYRNSNKEKLKEYKKNYYKENREDIRKKHAEYYKDNSNKIKESVARYRNSLSTENKTELRLKKQKRRLLKYNTDPIFKMKCRIRYIVWASFNRRGYIKQSSSSDITGCSLDDLRKYLLATWEKNYGKPWNGEEYHIDHIIPLATARTEEDVIRLCHYTNLQLLTPEDNLKKYNKIIL